MTIEEVVRKVLLDEHADVIREAVKAVAAEMMELEVSELIGAELGARRTEDRATHRNGYRSRRWDTRAGVGQVRRPLRRQFALTWCGTVPVILPESDDQLAVTIPKGLADAARLGAVLDVGSPDLEDHKRTF